MKKFLAKSYNFIVSRRWIWKSACFTSKS